MLRGYFGNNAGLYICMAITALMASPLPRLVRNITFRRKKVPRNPKTVVRAIKSAKENIQDGDPRTGEQGASNTVRSKGVPARHIAGRIPEAILRFGSTRSEASKTQTRRNRGRSTHRHTRRRTTKSTGTSPSRPRIASRNPGCGPSKRATRKSEPEDTRQNLIREKHRPSRRLSRDNSPQRRRRLGDSMSPLPRRARGDQSTSYLARYAPPAKGQRRP